MHLNIDPNVFVKPRHKVEEKTGKKKEIYQVLIRSIADDWDKIIKASAVCRKATVFPFDRFDAECLIEEMMDFGLLRVFVVETTKTENEINLDYLIAVWGGRKYSIVANYT